ncbi:MAG: carbohydrate kinase family protein [Firmicutes bacterium]|jgi:sugar/nucleoside kinase (ribokinase family)|nr:carbohydrate kinase family protein [Bacillota bacterium]
MNKIDVVALGAASLDVVVQVPRLPGYDEKVFGRMLGQLPGGTMPNFACALSKLGANVGWTGSVGGDQGGQLILDDFKKQGVDVSEVRIVEGESTGLAIVLVDPTGERAIVVIPMKAPPKALDEGQRHYISRAKVLYTAPYDLESFLDAAQCARDSGTLVAVDIEDTCEVDSSHLETLFGLIDIAILNKYGLGKVKRQAEALTGHAVEDIVGYLLSLGPRLVAVTLGADGCMLATSEQRMEARGVKVDVVDTTGAGDCFNSALVFGFLNGWDLSTMGTFANAAAAMSIRKYGARTGQPTFDDVIKFASEHGLSLRV